VAVARSVLMEAAARVSIEASQMVGAAREQATVESWLGEAIGDHGGD